MTHFSPTAPRRHGIRTRFPASLVYAALAALASLGCGGAEEPAGSGSESAAEAGPRPNVILVTLDTVRADYLTCYGASTGGTPAIDALASGGTLFEHAVSSSGLTPASHATILTGKFQYHHGVRVLAADSGFRLDDEHETLASKFKAAGYQTGAVHSAFPVSSHFGFARDFDHFDSFDAELKPRPGRGKVGWDVGTFQRRSDETTERTLAWLAEAEAAEEPFFLWIHYWDPHDPVKMPPPAEWMPLVKSDELKDITDRQTQEYAGEVRWQDGNIATLLNGLESKGLMDKTLFAVTADHGQGLEDGLRLHGWNNHRMLYREQVHVPLIFKGPGVPSGKRVVDQVRTADLAPTLLELAGVTPIEDRIDGESLVGRIRGDESGDLVAYGEQINGYDFNAAMRKHRPDATFLHMVSDGEWKLIFKPAMPTMSELFHVAIDPEEKRNVIGENPEQYLRLMADLAERNPWVIEPFPKTELTEEEAAAGVSDIMGSLGYSAAEKGTGEWWWTCPEHWDVKADARGRHEEGDCKRIMVPMGIWNDPEPAKPKGK